MTPSATPVLLGAVYAGSWSNSVRELSPLGTLGWENTDALNNVTSVDTTDDVPRTIIAGSWDGFVRRINYAGEVQSTIEVGEFITCVAVDNNNNVYVGTTEDVAYKYNAQNELVWSFTGHSGNITGIAVDTSGNVYTSSTDDTLRKIDSNGNELWRFEDDDMKNFNAVAVDASGNVYGASQSTMVCKLDTNGNEIWRFANHTNSVTAIAVDLAGNAFSTGYDNTLYAIDSAGGGVVWGAPLTSSGHSISATPDGSVYVGLDNGEVVKFNGAGVPQWTRVVGGRIASVISAPKVGAFTSFWTSLIPTPTVTPTISVTPTITPSATS